jgi:hypothetical protein
LHIAALQLPAAAVMCLAHDATADTATAASPSAGPSDGFELDSFSSNCLADASVLEVLAAHSLTRLNIAVKPSGGSSALALAAALARLSSLQELSLASTADGCSLPGSCLGGILQMNRLTALQLQGRWRDVVQPLQRALATHHKLRKLRLDIRGLHDLKIAHLIHLEELCLQQLPVGVALPEQLQHLELTRADAASMEHVLLLQELRSVNLHIDFRGSLHLLRLVEMPALQCVMLSYNNAQSACAVSPIWCRLPQLHELCVLIADSSSNWPSKRQFKAMLANIAACTGLTRLELFVDVKPSAKQRQQQQQAGGNEHHGGLAAAEEMELPAQQQQLEPALHEHGLAVFSCLAGLIGLHDLKVACMTSITPGDAAALTTLTALTRLVVKGAVEGVGDGAACALASSLTKLRHLELDACGLHSMACLKDVAQLQQLTELQLQVTSAELYS